MAASGMAETVLEAIEEAATADEAVATAVATIHDASSRYDWTGVYLVDAKGNLVLAHFRGAPTPHTTISVDTGICGAAVREGSTIVVPDVTSDPRYLSCHIETRSEIVVPIMKDGKVYGEIDVDSHSPAAFAEEDRRQLEVIAAALAERLAASGKGGSS